MKVGNGTKKGRRKQNSKARRTKRKNRKNKS